jgi:hypothetical protein
VTKQYVNDFSDNNTKESVEKLPEKKRPALVKITNPIEFIERVKNFFLKKGVKQEEILIEPVEYLNKKEPFISTRRFPYELFLKDSSFSYQSEIRIVINTKNHLILQELAENNNIVNIGSLQDISSVEEFYYDDMFLELRGNKLSSALAEPIKDLPKEELLSMVYRIINDDIEVRNGNKKSALQDIEDILRTKHNIHSIELPEKK